MAFCLENQPLGFPKEISVFSPRNEKLHHVPPSPRLSSAGPVYEDGCLRNCSINGTNTYADLNFAGSSCFIFLRVVVPGRKPLLSAFHAYVRVLNEIVVKIK